MKRPDLWKRIQAHRFDAPGSTTFFTKLAEASGWTDAFTARAIEEYRRFVYLTQVSDTQVTPSADIDRVWHLHMTFTRNYWDQMCGRVLGRPLHHETSTGTEARAIYEMQYDKTRALYEREFGEVAPEDLWPTAETDAVGKAASTIGSVGGFTIFLGICSLFIFGASGVILLLAGAAMLGYAVYLTAKWRSKKYARRAVETGMSIEIAMFADGGRGRGYDPDSGTSGDGDGDGDGGGCGD